MFLAGMVEIPRPFDPSTQAQVAQGMLQANSSSVIPVTTAIQVTDNVSHTVGKRYP